MSPPTRRRLRARPRAKPLLAGLVVLALPGTALAADPPAPPGGLLTGPPALVGPPFPIEAVPPPPPPPRVTIDAPPPATGAAEKGSGGGNDKGRDGQRPGDQSKQAEPPGSPGPNEGVKDKPGKDRGPKDQPAGGGPAPKHDDPPRQAGRPEKGGDASPPERSKPKGGGESGGKGGGASQGRGGAGDKPKPGRGDNDDKPKQQRGDDDDKPKHKRGHKDRNSDDKGRERDRDHGSRRKRDHRRRGDRDDDYKKGKRSKRGKSDRDDDERPVAGSSTRVAAIPLTASGGFVSTGVVQRLRRPAQLAPLATVRIAGRMTRRGARVTLLSVRAPSSTLVSVSCRGRDCPARVQTRTVAASARPSVGEMKFRSFQRHLRGGTVIQVSVTKQDMVGKFTRFVIRAGKAPLRADMCIAPGARRPSACS